MNIFSRFIVSVPLGEGSSCIDARGLFEQQCYDEWKRSREFTGEGEQAQENAAKVYQRTM